MRLLYLILIYLMFFLSGAAALMYQVVWVRSLSLVFGGTHLAVTAVLSTFMAGLALGGYWIGKHVDRVSKPLRLYGLLEIGVALSAILFVGLMKLYPSIYIFLAQGRDNSPLYLSLVRTGFSVLALIVPTTLMGGTLPVLSRFVTRHPENLKRFLSLLYGLNTLGAVAGAAAAGFFFLRLTSVSTTLSIAIATNLAIGLASLWLQKSAATAVGADRDAPKRDASSPGPVPAGHAAPSDQDNLLPRRLVFWGIGVSGFCALGYEVLWTKILTIVVGASVYGFTTMLVAFLTGIALGSKAYGLAPRLLPWGKKGIRESVAWFGIVQIIIGLTALLVTIHIRDLPSHAIALLNYFQSQSDDRFTILLGRNLALAFAYMVVPAFFMGLAFPLAGIVHAGHKEALGKSVGEVLAANTVGAILGAAVSGFVMLRLFGIERSLQILIVINTGYGLLVVLSLLKIRILNWGTVALTLSAILFLGTNRDVLNLWDTKLLAIYQNNRPDVYKTPELIREAIENTEILYYAEGLEATISSIRPKGGDQAVLVNGKVVASDRLEGQQCQYTLGHLPMLLHKNPRKVLVVGLGTGMTLGATSVHPSVETLALAEIEPKVLPAARTFENFNHQVLDDPRLRIFFNDGRNFLLTTGERFDVITADPIHPWAQGASYLYTAEYFKLAAARLLPKGIMAQWLPIYEMSTDDLKSVVRTFGENFRYTSLWLTHYDAELVGSNSPVVIDESELQRRIGEPRVLEDLQRVNMGSATDFLSYFVTGTEGLNAFGRGGILNTDDNLYLEFSSPLSIGIGSVMAGNVRAVTRYRESILPYLHPASDPETRAEQERTWAANRRTGALYDEAHAIYLAGQYQTPEFESLMARLENENSEYGPGRFLKNQYRMELSMFPRLLDQTALMLVDETGNNVVVRISAVVSRISRDRVVVMFVDNDAQVIYDLLYVIDADEDAWVRDFAADVIGGVQSAYQREVEAAKRHRSAFPPREPTLNRIKEVITLKVNEKKAGTGPG